MTFSEIGEKTQQDLVRTSSYIQMKSQGGKGQGSLYMPSESFKDILNRCELLFNKFHGETLNLERRPIERLASKLEKMFPTVPREVLKLYSKTRFFIRIKYLNKKILEKEKSTKRKHLNHVSKIIC